MFTRIPRDLYESHAQILLDGIMESVTAQQENVMNTSSLAICSSPWSDVAKRDVIRACQLDCHCDIALVVRALIQWRICDDLDSAQASVFAAVARLVFLLLIRQKQIFIKDTVCAV